MTKLGIYVRVSTEEQSTKGISLPDQKRRGEECARKHSFDEFEIFEDAGISGEKPFTERPSLIRLFEKILLGEITGLFVTDLDRLARPNPAERELLKAELKKMNVRLFDANSEINLKDINQEFLTDIRFLLAAFENKKTSARIKEKLEGNVINGKVGGGLFQPFGYKKNEHKMLIVDEVEAAVVKDIFRMSIEGKGTRIIASQLNDDKVQTKRNKNAKGSMKMKVKGKTLKANSFIWRDAVIYKILTNPLYKGQRQYKGKTYKCPAIIEEGLFDAVQEALSKRKHFKDTTNKHFYMLKGLILCARCRSRLYGLKREDLSDNQYMCSSQRYRDGWCKLRGINIDRLDSYVWNSILDIPKDLKKDLKDYNKDEKIQEQLDSIQKMKAFILKLERGKTKLLNLYADGIGEDEAVKKQIKIRSEKIKILEGKIHVSEKRMSYFREHDAILLMVNALINPAKKGNLTPEEKQHIIRSLVKYVVIQWNENIHQHLIWIEYKIDNTTPFAIGKGIEINYKKFGAVLRKNDENNRFLIRRIQPHPNTPTDLDSVFFNMRMNDDTYMEKMLM